MKSCYTQLLSANILVRVPTDDGYWPYSPDCPLPDRYGTLWSPLNCSTWHIPYSLSLSSRHCLTDPLHTDPLTLLVPDIWFGTKTPSMCTGTGSTHIYPYWLPNIRWPPGIWWPPYIRWMPYIRHQLIVPFSPIVKGVSKNKSRHWSDPRPVWYFLDIYLDTWIFGYLDIWFDLVRLADTVQTHGF